jgi:UDP-glucose 4-epimerase
MLMLSQILQVPYKVMPKRMEDVGAFYGNTDLAAKELGWTATMGLDEMCK